MTTHDNNFRWSDCSPWLVGEHLDGHACTVTIRGFTVEEVHLNGKPAKGRIVYFNEFKPGLPLSDKNKRTLAGLFGNNGANAIGQRVCLTPVPMRVGGKNRCPIIISAAVEESEQGGGLSAQQKWTAFRKANTNISDDAIATLIGTVKPSEWLTANPGKTIDDCIQLLTAKS